METKKFEPKSHTFRLAMKLLKRKEPKKYDRQKLQQQYIRITTELQRLWGNPIPTEWDLSGWNEEELYLEIKNTKGQLRYEKGERYFKRIIKLLVYIFVLFVFLGIIGLLVFGIKQIFN